MPSLWFGLVINLHKYGDHIAKLFRESYSKIIPTPTAMVGEVLKPMLSDIEIFKLHPSKLQL